MTIEQNIVAREAVEEVVEFALEIVLDRDFPVGAEYEQRFWEELARLVDERLPEPKEKSEKATRMNEATARRFGCDLMPYGEFAGKPIDEVPLDRLMWYADQTFTDDLRLYLESERMKGETRC